MTPARIATLSALFAAATLLAACSKEQAPAPSQASPAAPAPAAPAQQGVTIEEIQTQAQGFTAGQAMSARTVYVFFDAQCPHCGALWYAAKPLKSQAKFVWIPIRLLKDDSATQGAAILAAKDPSQAMDDHEASMMDKKGGIKPEGDVSAQRAIIKKNTELFNKFGFASVPALVTKNAQGVVATRDGSLPTPELAAFAGVTVPTQ